MRIEDVEVGASEAAAALGLSPYKTPAGLYAEKLRLVERDGGSEATFLGTHVEHAIADAFGARNDVRPRRWPTVRGALRPWLRVSPDRVLLAEDVSTSFRREHGLDPGEAVVVEIKTTGLASFRPRSKLDAEWGEAGSSTIPIQYFVQVQLQLAAMHAVLVEQGKGFVTRAIVPALIPGRGLVEFVVRSDAEAQARILDGLDRFVRDHLVPEVAPEPTTADDWKAYAEQARRPQTSKEIVRVDDGDPLSTLLADYVATDAFLKDAEANKERLRAKVIEAIGERYGIESSTARATYSAGKTAPKMSASGFAEEVLALARTEVTSDKSERAKFARLILDAAERNTRSAVTGRALRVVTKESE